LRVPEGIVLVAVESHRYHSNEELQMKPGFITLTFAACVFCLSVSAHAQASGDDNGNRPPPPPCHDHPPGPPPSGTDRPPGPPPQDGDDHRPPKGPPPDCGRPPSN
jgi:hypothetical protein